MKLAVLDNDIIHVLRKVSIPAARIGLFIVFFWFGFLKFTGLSPATDIVQRLHSQTIPFIDFHNFYVFFAAFECIIGILFIIKGAERIVMPLLLLHMAATFLPLFFLPDVTWQQAFVPTLEGQYIIKNLVIVATAIAVTSHIHPIKK